MAVLKAKQPGVLKIEMTHVNDIRSVPRLLDIKSFNHDRKTGVLNSLINREAGICGLVVGDAAKEDFIIPAFPFYNRSEEHTSELQSRGHLVCRLLLEKKKIVSKVLIQTN